MRLSLALALLFLEFFHASLPAQSHTYPYRENFDTARAPLLPLGWSTTRARSTAGDFTTSASTPLSSPLAVLSTDARIAQCLTSPPLSFTGRTGGSLEFFERRSSSYTAGLLIEGSIHDDSLSWLPVSDTLLIASSSSYVRRAIQLPSSLNNQPFVRIRWRTLGNGTGATGTLRIDDITVTVARSVDLALDSMIIVPSSLAADDDVPCTIILRNKAQPGTFTCSLAMSDSSLGTWVADTTFTNYFGVGDSLTLVLTYPHIRSGVHRIFCTLTMGSDEDSANNVAVATIAVQAPAHALVINEVMYEPFEGSPEYVELYNRSGVPIDLGGWNMGDASGTAKHRMTIPLPKQPHWVPAFSMCVIADDSTIVDHMSSVSAESSNFIIVPSLGLNNSGDDILLFDPAGATTDSVRYSPSWHLPNITTIGKSLERINPDLPGTDPRNWSTSVAPRGGTPGARNSIYTVAAAADESLVLSPNPFSPNNDGVDDFLGITITLPSPGSAIRVRIFDAAGRLVRTLANNEPAAPAGTILWNGRDDTNTRVRMGMYIVFVEVLDTRGGVLRAMKGVAVVATKLE
jgi:hypothetical protein